MTIPLSHFAEFVSRSGIARIKIVQSVKDHDRAKDGRFYDPIRDAIVMMHKSVGGSGVAFEEQCERHLKAFLASRSDVREQRCFPEIAAGYMRFIRSVDTMRITWLDPPAGTYPVGGIEIDIAPPLGLAFDGIGHFIVPYFHAQPISPKHIAALLNILQTSPLGAIVPGCTFGLLDVRKARLHTLRAPSPRMNILLRAKAMAFSTIYAAV